MDSYSIWDTPMDKSKPRAVCLIRNPFSALVAMTNQGHSKNHTGFASEATFREKRWQVSVRLQVKIFNHTQLKMQSGTEKPQRVALIDVHN